MDDIALTLQKGLGVRGAAHLLSLAGSASAVYAASEGELSGKFGLRSDIARALAAKTAHREAEEELRYMRRHGISAVASTDADYPALLRECPDYPHVLYFVGDAAAFRGRMLSVVGTRAATVYGQQMCDALVGRVAELAAGTAVVSGLAYGIDAAAHRAALRYGLRTVAVIANPLPGVTPVQHRALAHDIAERGGAVVTEKKCRLAVAFIYLSDQLVDSSVIEDRMKTALARIAEKVAANAETEQTPQVS